MIILKKRIGLEIARPSCMQLQKQDQSPGVFAYYLWNRREDVFNCRQAHSTEDYLSLIKIGKRLKDSSIASGFPELAALGNELVRAATQRDEKSADLVIAELSKWVLRCGSAFKRCV